jgi:hypothetical protein
MPPEKFVVEGLRPSDQGEESTLDGKGHTERVASSLLTSPVALPPPKFEPNINPEDDRMSPEEFNDDDGEYDYDDGFTIDIDEMETDGNEPITTNDEPSSGVEIVDFNPEDIQEPNDFQLKTRNDVYYEIYTNAKKKAEEARNLAISAYLEAKRIKDLYMIHEPLDIFTGDQQN